ncbi:hypothetical protein I4U23_008609 [Adineta vaga]|nr:hypothetical protein I4U23_008609 [Adineta vaga]
MTATAPKRTIQHENRPLRCSHSHAHLVYDDPYVFRVRGQRSRSSYYRPCDVCFQEANRQQTVAENIRYEQRCSRMPPKPIYIEDLRRSKTTSRNRMSAQCNWDNFMEKKSKYAIETPYATCNLTDTDKDEEKRPAFVNYGGHYKNRQYGDKRTFNSFAVHQMKHHEANDQQLRDLFRERHLRDQAENYFHKIEKQNARDKLSK